MNEASSAQAQIQRGQILQQQGRYKDAEGYFREALGIDPTNAWTFFHLAICQFGQKQFKVAKETILQAIQREPNEANFHSFHSQILSELDQYAEALKVAEQAVALNPNCIYAYNSMGKAWIGQEKWPEVEKIARQALTLDPNDTVAASQLALALRLQNKMAENAEQIRGMLQREPENEFVHSSAGWASLQRGDLKQAEIHFQEALRLNPDLEQARSGLIESFKARSPIYRLYLNYCFFMQRLSQRVRWGLVIGVYLLVRVLSTTLRGTAPLLCLGIVGAYMIFVLWVHVAPGVGYFIVLLDRFARYALRRQEIYMALSVGGGMTLALVLIPVGLIFSWNPAVIIGLTLAGAAFPFRYAFNNESKAGMWLFGTMACTVLGIGILALAANFQPKWVPQNWVSAGTTLAVFLVAGTTWICNVPSLRR